MTRYPESLDPAYKNVGYGQKARAHYEGIESDEYEDAVSVLKKSATEVAADAPINYGLARNGELLDILTKEIYHLKGQLDRVSNRRDYAEADGPETSYPGESDVSSSVNGQSYTISSLIKTVSRISSELEI